MSKKQTFPKTSIADLVATIDVELNLRSEALDAREAELDARKQAIQKEREDLDAAIATFSQEKADFELSSSEVQAKFVKIRNDEQLTATLREQALERKANDKALADSQENLNLAKLKLDEVARRELQLSEREKQYKDEIQKKVVLGFFKE